MHNFPAFCISLGFAYQKEAVVGVIYNPTLRELYTGIKGQGSFLSRNGSEKQRLPLRQPEPLTGLDKCLVGVEWGSERSGNNYAIKANTFRKLGASKEEGGAMVHSMRSLGSAALNLAMVAAGSQDVWWEGGPWAWDVCAGAVLVKESGGILVGGNPGEWDVELEGRSYLAVRGSPGGQGQREVVEEVWGCMDGQKMVYEG